MNSKIIANGILRALGIIIAIGLLLYFLYQIQSVIVYIAVAAVISLIGRPIVLFLRRKLKFNNSLAVVVTMVLFIGLFVGLIGLFIPLVAEQSQNLALLDIEELQNNIQDLYSQIVHYFELNNIDVEQSIKDSGLLSKLDFAYIRKFQYWLIFSFIYFIFLFEG